MIIIQPNGTIETKVYKDHTSISQAVNPPGRDDPFTTVPQRDGMACGYTVYANDNGMLIPLSRNVTAEDLTGYPELYGPICVASFEEAGEDECLCYVTKKSKAAFERLLEALKAQAGDDRDYGSQILEEALRMRDEAKVRDQFVFEGEYADIPEQTQDSLKYYLSIGQGVGGFLMAVLSNDLFEAVVRADLEHREQLATLARWIHFKTPSASHGSKQAVETWIKHQGLQGAL